MSSDHDIDMYDVYISDTFNRYEELIGALSEASSTADFKARLMAINHFMTKNPDAFGKSSQFISMALLENLDAIKGIEKIWRQQRRDRRQNLIYFILGIFASALVSLIFYLLSR